MKTRPGNLYPSPALPQLPAGTASAFFHLFNGFHESIVVINAAYEIVFMNQKAVAHYHNDVIAITPHFLDLVPVRRRTLVKGYINDGFAGKTTSFEVEKQDADTLLWLAVTYSPVKNAEGEVEYVYMFLKDITERKKAELYKEELRRTEEKLYKVRQLFEQFMENSPLAAWIVDAGGALHYMNPVYQQTWGVEADYKHKTIHQLFPAALADSYQSSIADVLRQNKAIIATEKGHNPNGGPMVLKVFMFPIMHHSQRMVAGWAIDITDHIELQHQLSQNVERYQYVNQATSDAIYDWDITTQNLLRGQGFEALFGYAEASATISSALSRIHPADRQRVADVMYGSFAGAGCHRWEVDYSFLHRSGHYRHVRDKAFITRNAEGEAIRAIGAMQDITEQVVLQQTLLKAESAKKQEIVKSIIEAQEKERRQLSVELHDNVNQILSSCKLMLEVASQDAAKAPELTRLSYTSLQLAITEIRGICHALNPSALEDIGLKEAIEQLISTINASGKITVVFNYLQPNPEDGLITEDRVSVYRIIQELLNNILKHAQATAVHIGVVVSTAEATVTVQDNGVGFNPAAVKKGLGMRNVQNRADYYGGTLHIQSGPGEGCITTVVLQLA